MTYKFVTREEIEEAKKSKVAPVWACWMVGIAYRLLAERDAYREVAIQERKDLEEMEDNFEVVGGFDGKHREEIPGEIDSEAARIQEVMANLDATHECKWKALAEELLQQLGKHDDLYSADKKILAKAREAGL